MDIPKFQELGAKAATIKEQLQTEEAVKTAIILPFIQLLSYDVFDPSVVNPEFTADLGIKKGEKVDYAILEYGSPVLIIECKHWRQSLTAHGSQLHRYFNCTPCKFAMLTNGIEYQIFSDFDAANIMDEMPFFSFNISAMNTEQYDFLEWFHSDFFEVGKAIEAARNMKYTARFSNYLDNQFTNPDENFMRFIIAQVYNGKLTDKAWRDLSPLVRQAILKF